MKSPTDIITWKMTRQQLWRLERIRSAFIGISDMTNQAEEYGAISLILSPLIEDLADILGEIEKANSEWEGDGSR